MKDTSEKIEIQNGNTGRTERVDKKKYLAMRTAYVKVLSKKTTGQTYNEIKEKVLPLLPADLFPEGQKAGWWIKAVQLDLEAKGVVLRLDTKPLRFCKN